jgi:hypothetical protein
VAYSYWPALNADNTRLFVQCGGQPTLFQVNLQTGSIQSLGPAFQAVQLWWEGTARFILYDFGNHTFVVLKDLLTDPAYTGFWGSSGTYLWQMSLSANEERFAATVRESGSGTELGAVIWDASTGQVWNYRIPSGEALDEVQIDRSGSYLVIKLLGRRWQVWKLSDSSPSAVMADGPGHSDNGDALLYQGHGSSLTSRPLDPPGSPAAVYAAPQVEGKVNGYADAHTSALALDGWVYYGTHTTVAGGGLVTSWTPHAGSVYRLDYNEEIAARPYKRLPEIVRMGRIELEQQGQIPTGPGQWFLDSSGILYVWNPSGEDPNAVNMIAYDWRPTHEEIVRVREDGSAIERLAHHHSHVDSYGEMPRGSISYDGRYFVFNSNWGGQNRIDVYAVDVTAP